MVDLNTTSSDFSLNDIILDKVCPVQQTFSLQYRLVNNASL